jgi:chemotaxis family two-component system response regulator Rcp1
MKAKKLRILLVEDNPEDVLIAERSLMKANMREQSELFVVRDGQEALDFLRRQGKFSEAARPDLILLDLKLPKVNGHEVLAEIKRDDRLRRIPVIVLTVSEREEDMVKAYNSGASGYITKPPSSAEFAKVIETVLDYWRISELPSQSGNGVEG